MLSSRRKSGPIWTVEPTQGIRAFAGKTDGWFRAGFFYLAAVVGDVLATAKFSGVPRFKSAVIGRTVSGARRER